MWKKKDGSNPAAPIMNALRGTTATVLVTSRDGELLHKDLGVAVHRIALLNDDEERALESLNLAVELNSHDAASRWQYAERLRHLPGRLTEATDHMRAVLRTVDSHPQAARTLDEDVKRLRDLNDPPRTWQRELANLSALVIFVVALVLSAALDLACRCR